jgi:hypothetical protein
MYVQLVQRQQANEMFNRGMAGMVAAFSPLSQRNAIAHQWDNMSGDPNAVMGNIMRLQDYQYQQQQRQLIQQSLPDIAAKTGLSVPALQGIIAANPAALGDILRTTMPTEEQRNVQWEHDQFIKGGGSEDDWQKNYMPLIISRGMPGMNDPMYRTYLQEQRQAQEAHSDQPFPDYATWTANRQATAVADKQQAKDIAQASTDRPALTGTMSDIRGKVQSIIDAGQAKPGEQSQLGRVLAAAPFIPPNQMGTITSEMAAKLGLPYALNQDDLSLLNKINELSDYDTKTLLAAYPKRAQDIASISTNLSTLRRYGLSPGEYMGNLNGILTAVNRTDANGYGAAQDLGSLPENLRPYLDRSYMPGGSNFRGQGKQMSADQIAQAKQEAAQVEKQAPGQGRRAAIQDWGAQGYDTTALEQSFAKG